MCKPTQFNFNNLSFAAWLLVVLGLEICFLSGPLGAAPFSQQSFDGRVVKHYGTTEGLRSAWIHDVLQTSDGYLWIATHNGVARFDGTDFIHFNRSNTPELPANDIRVLSESHDGTLWIGTIGGLVQYNSSRPASFQRHDTFRGNSVHAIYEDSDRVMWIGTREDTWTRGTDGAFVLQEAAPAGVRALCQDSQGTLWLGADSGLYVRRNSGFERFDHPRLPASSVMDSAGSAARVNTLLADGDDLWVGTNRGLLHVSNGSGDVLGDSVGQRQVWDLAQVDGLLYAATRHGLWRSADGNQFLSLETGDFSSCVATDREGGLWVGHYDNRGLFRFANTNTVTVAADLRVNCVYEEPSGSLWLGSFSGLHRLDASGRIDYSMDDGLPADLVDTIAQESASTFWIGTNRGFAKWNGSEITTVGVPPELAAVDVTSALQDSAGTLWFAERGGGGYRFKDNELTELEPLDHGTVSWFHEASDGSMWIGHEYGLFRTSDQQIQLVTDQVLGRLNSSHYLCIHASRDGTLWFGTSGGIARFRSGKFELFTTEHGLAADYIDRIIEDNHGNLWLGGRDGFYYINLAQLEQFVAGDAPAIISRSVDHLKGVPTSKTLPKGCMGKDGTTSIAGHRGLIQISPASPPKYESPEVVHIHRISVDGEPITAPDTFEFVSGPRRLAIEFSAPTFTDASLSRIRYKLDGHSSDWMDAGSERIAYYTDLAPGDYRFRVIAANPDGIRNEQGASVQFTVRPRWWEHNSLRGLIALSLIGIGVWFFRYRTQRIRAANATLRGEISERKRAEETALRRSEELARVSRAASMGELTTSIAHEVNQPLFAIVSNAQTAQRLLDGDQPDLEEVHEALDDIASDGKRASRIIDRIRSLVRKEQPKKELLDLNHVAREVIKIVGPEFRERGTALDADLADPLPLVEGDPIELQQVILNLLINGAQSMDGVDEGTRAVLITTSADQGWVEVAVRDWGSGLDETHADRIFEAFFTTKEDGTGMGLAINRTIIEAHGGKIWADLNVDKGATFRFTLQRAGDDTK